MDTGTSEPLQKERPVQQASRSLALSPRSARSTNPLATAVTPKDRSAGVIKFGDRRVPSSAADRASDLSLRRPTTAALRGAWDLGPFQPLLHVTCGVGRPSLHRVGRADSFSLFP